MTKTTIYVPDIECDSCVKLIKRALDREKGIQSIEISDDAVEISHESSIISPGKIISIIKKNGFRASTEPFDRMSFTERWRHFKENTHKYQLEKNIFIYSVLLFFILSVIELIGYFTLFYSIPDFVSRYTWWLFYLNITISTLTAAVWHITAYEARMTCMVGMMIGMTFGMQTGMMIGAILGATNGFFIGALIGMIAGVIIGSLCGKCCGIMGVMEGMMAGVMGGTMGSMITVMMLSDHILLFMPFFMLFNVIIVWGLSYMMYEEVVENNRAVKQKPADFILLLSIAIIITIIIMAIMFFGPKSLIVR